MQPRANDDAVLFGVVGAFIAGIVSIILLVIFVIPGKNDPRHFPTGATNIQDVGNGYFTFELEMSGVKHKFIKGRNGLTEIHPK